MSRCLSDRAILRVYVGGGTTGQQIHVDACDRCAMRSERIRQDLTRITRTLTEAPEPSPPRAWVSRRWAPAVGLAMIAVLAVVWMETTPLPGIVPGAGIGGGEVREAASLLREVSLVMFSVSGDLIAPAGDPLAELGPLAFEDPACDTGDGLDMTCSGSLGGAGAAL